MTFFEQDTRDTSWKHADDPFSRLRREHRRKRRVRASVIAGVLVASLAGFVVVTGPEKVLGAVEQLLQPQPPSDDIVALADRAFLTEEGRALLYASRPRVADLEVIASMCARDDDADEAEGTPTGCFDSWRGIAVYQPADARVADDAVTTLAHELLHAAYEELGSGEIWRIQELLHVEIARVPADDPVHAQIDASVGGYDENRDTELFAYLGTQIMPDGGFAPELEAVYARYISDRAALVQVHRQVDATIDAVYAEAVAAQDALVQTEAANAAERAQLAADRVAHETALAQYNADADRYNALPESERAFWSATWQAPDGASIQGSLGDVLARRLAALEAARTSIESRQAALRDAEAAALIRRDEVEAQLEDLTTLFDAASPAG